LPDSAADARAHALLEAWERRNPEAGNTRSRWLIGAVMFALGALSGFATSAAEMIPHFPRLPSLLP
jgi:hypothetical protein